MSMNSSRSRDETKSMYKKLSWMSMATAAMMSTKHDYVSLKELSKSIDDHENYNLNQSNESDFKLTKSDIPRK